LQIVCNLLSKYGVLQQLFATFEALVLEPKNVKVPFVLLNEIFIVERLPAAVRGLFAPSRSEYMTIARMVTSDKVSKICRLSGLLLRVKYMLVL
jgi:hypothetical protein